MHTLSIPITDEQFDRIEAALVEQQGYPALAPNQSQPPLTDELLCAFLRECLQNIVEGSEENIEYDVGRKRSKDRKKTHPLFAERQ